MANRYTQEQKEQKDLERIERYRIQVNQTEDLKVLNTIRIRLYEIQTGGNSIYKASDKTWKVAQEFIDELGEKINRIKGK